MNDHAYSNSSGVNSLPLIRAHGVCSNRIALLAYPFILFAGLPLLLTSSQTLTIADFLHTLDFAFPSTLLYLVKENVR